MTTATSTSLLLRIRDHVDSESWQTFQLIYSPIIRAYCFRRGMQAADVDDLVQEVLTAVAQSIGKFDYQPEKGRFRSWLWMITNNEIRKLLAKRKGERIQIVSANDLDLFAATDSDSDWVDLFSNHIFQVACENIRSQVEARTWESFEQAWLKQVPATSVATATGIPVHTVYVNKSRVLKRLREEVQRLAFDAPFHFEDR